MMQYRTAVSLTYVILYVLYVLLGPHSGTNLLHGGELRVATSIRVALVRMMFLSYIGLLYSAYYFYNPTPETFVVALLVSCVAAVGFYAKWGSEMISMHLLLLLPLLISAFAGRVRVGAYRFGSLSAFTLAFLVLYAVFQDDIYRLHDTFEREDTLESYLAPARVSP